MNSDKNKCCHCELTTSVDDHDVIIVRTSRKITFSEWNDPEDGIQYLNKRKMLHVTAQICHHCYNEMQSAFRHCLEFGCGTGFIWD